MNIGRLKTLLENNKKADRRSPGAMRMLGAAAVKHIGELREAVT
jgi:hypothetical protein